MKKKSRKQSLKRRHEFRYYNRMSINKRGRMIRYRHPAYVFLEKGNLYIFVTITHSNSVENHLVVKLEKNPNPEDKKDAYYVAEVKQDTKDRFRKRLSNWKISESDDKAIRLFFEKEKR